jgi:hypothetical protein
MVASASITAARGSRMIQWASSGERREAVVLAYETGIVSPGGIRR